MPSQLEVLSVFSEDGVANVEVSGKPHLCLQQAHEICSSILYKQGPWHFHTLDFTREPFFEGGQTKNFHFWHLKAVAILDSKEHEPETDSEQAKPHIAPIS